MHWEDLTAPDFEAAVRTAGKICLLPIGCLEKHGNHLPLGTDYIFVKHLAGLAAEIEPAIVFPPYYFSQINEARHCPGTIAIGHDLLMNLLEACCNEIARNGLTRIVLVNGHGGNTFFLKFFCQIMLEKQRDYVVYLYESQPRDAKVEALLETTNHAHAEEVETSQMLVVRPESVRMHQIGQDGNPLDRMAAFRKRLFAGIGWYADYPAHYAGQAESASESKGRALLEEQVGHLAAAIRLAKSDDTPARLQAEFYRLTQPVSRNE